MEKKNLLVIKPEKPTERLIMYCKLLKYLRKLQIKEAELHIKEADGTFYRKICKNAFFPFMKRSPYPWDKQWYYAFWHHDIYGWMVVSLTRLNDVKL